MFFPAADEDELEDDAKAICATCPVRSQCLDAGLISDVYGIPYGIWGGRNQQERQIILDKRRRTR